MFIKHFPKFPLLDDTKISKNALPIERIPSIESFDSSSILEGTNKNEWQG
jgi:hypothetical protein